ncbi:MAG TPA: NBR1-Ig-like domain-containing protein [Anaerolineales bacterium]|nr:NBR1-Ig-like domain-containing protein [Anaerolineales bacterium]
MKTKLFVFITLLMVTTCTSSPTLTQTKAVTVSSPINFPTQTLTLAPTNTSIPFPTLTLSITPIVSITPQPGFQVWGEGSALGQYAIQYSEDKWLENGNSLTHKDLPECSMALAGGSDICMSGGCVTSKVILGEIEFGKTVVSNSTAIYSSYPINIHLFYQAWLGENPSKCIQQVEEVLSTIKLRPTRGCTDRAAYVADVTIPDNTVIPAGTKFIKTWRLKNVGTCTWTNRYSLIVMGKSPGTEADWIALNTNVQPQETIDLSIELPAPTVQGTARWESVIQNELGDWFGIGSGPYTDIFGKPFWVQIIVVPTPTP